MSLNWNIEKAKDWESLDHKMTDIIVWLTMAVGIGTITKANAKEFYARVHLSEKLYDTYATVDGKPYHITYEDIETRIGLTTNVSNLTRNQFLNEKVSKRLDAWKEGV